MWRNQCLLVAELSANHDQSLETALHTIEAAAKAGANAIKIQTYTPDTLTLRLDTEHFVVRTDNVWAGKTLHQLYAEAMTPWEWTAALQQKALEQGLIFFSTPFDRSAVDFLERHDVPLYKIASFELTDLALISYVARRGKPIVLSTGMATWAEIEAAVKTCREAGNEQIALLRCVSAYPAESHDLNLASLRQLATLADIGLSDHTRDHTAAVTAVAMGARIVEKHFILDRSVGGPDAFFSLEPAEFAEMARRVRAVEATLGEVRFGPTAAEEKSLVFRRSLFVAEAVRAGEVLTCDNVRSVRPGYGLPASSYASVLGCIATCDLDAGTPLARAHLKAAEPVERLELVPGDDSVLAWASVFAGPRVRPETFWMCEQGALALRHMRGAIWWLDVAVAPPFVGRGALAALVHAGCLEAAKMGASIVQMHAVPALKELGFYGFNDGICERSLA